MRTGSLVLRPQITAFDSERDYHILEYKYVHNTTTQSLPGSRSEDDTQRYWQHVGKTIMYGPTYWFLFHSYTGFDSLQARAFTVYTKIVL